MYIQGPRYCAPARPAYLGEKLSIPDSITDIYVPRVHPLGEWFHVSLVLWEFERQATTLNYLYTPDSMLQLLKLETAMATTTTTRALLKIDGRWITSQQGYHVPYLQGQTGSWT